MTCMRLVMRHGSVSDKFVYKGAMVGQKTLCEDQQSGTSSCQPDGLRYSNTFIRRRLVRGLA